MQANWVKKAEKKHKPELHDTEIDLGEGLILRFDSTYTLDTWNVWLKERPIGQVFVDTTVHPPAVSSISINSELRGQGIGPEIIQALAKYYGSITSDRTGNTSSSAHSMWKKVPDVQQIDSPEEQNRKIWLKRG